jgi:hypothetical protein
MATALYLRMIKLRMKKKHRRQWKKTTKTLRKALKRGSAPLGVATGALTLGGLAAVVAFDPEVRDRSRAFAGAARDFFRRLGSGAREAMNSEHQLAETTH